jgi:hypothetical protein
VYAFARNYAGTIKSTDFSNLQQWNLDENLGFSHRQPAGINGVISIGESLPCK